MADKNEQVLISPRWTRIHRIYRAMKISGQVVNMRYITSCLFISNKNIDFKIYLYIKQKY